MLLAMISPPSIVISIGCALTIKLTSRGPVFFHQERVGMNGQPFRMLKFRTMVHGPEPNPIFPRPDRITGIGTWLRRFSIDELPQLINVARGDMSLVGPRPTLPYQADRYDQRQRRRLMVRPGLTGLAQIRGRNGLVWSQRIEHDLEYIERQSVRLDVKILAATLAVALRGSGVEGHPADDPLARLDKQPLT